MNWIDPKLEENRPPLGGPGVIVKNISTGNIIRANNLGHTNGWGDGLKRLFQWNNTVWLDERNHLSEGKENYVGKILSGIFPGHGPTRSYKEVVLCLKAAMIDANNMPNGAALTGRLVEIACLLWDYENIRLQNEALKNPVIDLSKLKVVFTEGVQVSDQNLEGCLATLEELNITVSGNDKADAFKELLKSIIVLLANNSQISQEEIDVIFYPRIPLEVKKYTIDSFNISSMVHGKVKKVSSYGGSVFVIFQSDKCYRLSWQAYDQDIATMDTQHITVPVGGDAEFNRLEKELFRLYTLEGLANAASKAQSTVWLIKNATTPTVPAPVEGYGSEERHFIVRLKATIEKKMQEAGIFDDMLNCSICHDSYKDKKEKFFDSLNEVNVEKLCGKSTGNVPDQKKAIVQELRELSIYLDDLCCQTDKDAGNLWIQFSDKFNAFKELIGYALLREPYLQELFNSCGDIRTLLLMHPDGEMITRSCLHLLGDEAQAWWKNKIAKEKSVMSDEKIIVGKMSCVEGEPGYGELKWNLNFKTNKHIHYDKAVELCSLLEGYFNGEIDNPAPVVIEPVKESIEMGVLIHCNPLAERAEVKVRPYDYHFFTTKPIDREKVSAAIKSALNSQFEYAPRFIEVKEVQRYRDGGTIEYIDQIGRLYYRWFMNKKIYNQYPHIRQDNGELKEFVKEVNVKLIEVSEFSAAKPEADATGEELNNNLPLDLKNSITSHEQRYHNEKIYSQSYVDSKVNSLMRELERCYDQKQVDAIRKEAFFNARLCDIEDKVTPYKYPSYKEYLSSLNLNTDDTGKEPIAQPQVEQQKFNEELCQQVREGKLAIDNQGEYGKKEMYFLCKHILDIEMSPSLGNTGYYFIYTDDAETFWGFRMMPLSFPSRPMSDFFQPADRKDDASTWTNKATFTGEMNKDCFTIILKFTDDMKQRGWYFETHDRKDLSNGNVRINYVMVKNDEQ